MNQRIERAKETLRIEAEAINTLITRIDNTFVEACECILQSTGRVVVIGMGKSGHIGNKIAATLASTGTPAFFVHPAEASHGDLGMIIAEDIILAISNSGETEEVLNILPIIKRLGVQMIAMTGNSNSTLAKQSDFHLDISVKQEACPLNLAPTASTTATVALGDALAVALLDAKGFDSNDFARSHPGGKLGKRLLTYVADIMRPRDQLPIVTSHIDVLQAIMAMSAGGLGMVIICDNDVVKGVFTDGDLRRLFDSDTHKNTNFSSLLLSDFMVNKPVTINGGALAAEALQIMEEHKVSALPITDDNNQLVGALNMHDLLASGIV